MWRQQQRDIVINHTAAGDAASACSRAQSCPVTMHCGEGLLSRWSTVLKISQTEESCVFFCYHFNHLQQTLSSSAGERARPPDSQLRRYHSDDYYPDPTRPLHWQHFPVFSLSLSLSTDTDTVIDTDLPTDYSSLSCSLFTLSVGRSSNCAPLCAVALLQSSLLYSAWFWRARKCIIIIKCDYRRAYNSVSARDQSNNRSQAIESFNHQRQQSSATATKTLLNWLLLPLMLMPQKSSSACEVTSRKTVIFRLFCFWPI